MMEGEQLRLAKGGKRLEALWELRRGERERKLRLDADKLEYTGARAREGPWAGTLLPLQKGVRAVEVPVHPRGRVHDLPVELGHQGDQEMVEEGVRFEPRASGGLGSNNGGVGDSSGEGLALEAAVGRRGEGLMSPRWL